MRRALSVVGALAVVALASGAAAQNEPTITAFTATKSGTTVTMSGTATGFANVTNPLTQVFTDPPADLSGNDGWLDSGFAPPYQDLRAGYIGETPTTLTFIWEVEDIPDVLAPNGVPLLPAFYWDMTIDGVPYQLTVTFTARGTPVGSLQSNCRVENNVVMCDSVPSARVTASVDPVANRVTATVRRRDLRRDPTDLNSPTVAFDGAVLAEAQLFQGIAAYTGFVVLVSGATGDQADMARPYVLGRHVEGAIVPRGTSDEEIREFFFPEAVAVPDAATGAFSMSENVSGLPPGAYDAAAQACVGGVCGPIVRAPVTI